MEKFVVGNSHPTPQLLFLAPFCFLFLPVPSVTKLSLLAGTNMIVVNSSKKGHFLFLFFLCNFGTVDSNHSCNLIKVRAGRDLDGK